MVGHAEVWWHEAPDEKPRPYLVLTRGEALPLVTKVVAAPVTTRQRGIPSEVVLGEQDGMPTTCVISLDNVTLVRRSHLVRHMATLTLERWSDVCDAFRFAIAC